jgi:hypothetical protein
MGVLFAAGNPVRGHRLDWGEAERPRLNVEQRWKVVEAVPRHGGRLGRSSCRCARFRRSRSSLIWFWVLLSITASLVLRLDRSRQTQQKPQARRSAMRATRTNTGDCPLARSDTRDHLPSLLGQERNGCCSVRGRQTASQRITGGLVSHWHANARPAFPPGVPHQASPMIEAVPAWGRR